jgi:hypothetical protein
MNNCLVFLSCALIFTFFEANGTGLVVPPVQSLLGFLELFQTFSPFKLLQWTAFIATKSAQLVMNQMQNLMFQHIRRAVLAVARYPGVPVSKAVLHHFLSDHRVQVSGRVEHVRQLDLVSDALRVGLL